MTSAALSFFRFFRESPMTYLILLTLYVLVTVINFFVESAFR